MATLRQIAKLAGVSLGTASQALSGKGNVTVANINKVMDAARLLGYQPGTAPMPAVGLLMNYPFPVDSYVGWAYRFVSSAVEALGALGYNAVVKQVDLREERLRGTTARGMVRGYEGVLLYTNSLLDPEDTAFIGDMGVPLVVVGDAPEGLHSVTINNKRAMESVVRGLLGLGHTRISYVSYRDGVADDTMRRLGYERAMRLAGLHPQIIREGDLLGLPEGVTALACFDDAIAARVLRLAHAQGVRVPEELTVVGFGNLPEVVTLFPELTTVHQPLAEHASLAARTLVGVMQGNMTAVASTMLECSSMPRGTVGPPPANLQ